MRSQKIHLRRALRAEQLFAFLAIAIAGVSVTALPPREALPVLVLGTGAALGTWLLTRSLESVVLVGYTASVPVMAVLATPTAAVTSALIAGLGVSVVLMASVVRFRGGSMIGLSGLITGVVFLL